jgi:hypothetical protein
MKNRYTILFPRMCLSIKAVPTFACARFTAIFIQLIAMVTGHEAHQLATLTAFASALAIEHALEVVADFLLVTSSPRELLTHLCLIVVRPSGNGSSASARHLGWQQALGR